MEKAVKYKLTDEEVKDTLTDTAVKDVERIAYKCPYIPDSHKDKLYGYPPVPDHATYDNPSYWPLDYGVDSERIAMTHCVLCSWGNAQSVCGDVRLKDVLEVHCRNCGHNQGKISFISYIVSKEQVELEALPQQISLKTE